ncbi:hypothetical protein DKM44_10050 [Deinococcus irradiatisoli]|uniref:Uncharacterized protein n=1 Tax=Deinococcus irradiatisoli TaxID=2202254 RepID=A0A2Z3JRX5_9DEIO|nr:hypothetical protein [Deinococcus irradiatisoli]AWN23524.1 hypothetical protein DKM44_10050 [Deinococcus irradiatisoli]
MNLDSLTPVDHARRFGLLLASSLGTFVFVAAWMALGWNVVLAAVIGVAVGAAGFFPLRAVMRLFFPPPRFQKKVKPRSNSSKENSASTHF